MQAKVFEDPTCYLCGGTIDIGLPKGLPGSKSMDDLKPVSKDGNPNDIRNQKASHQRCNSQKGALPVDVAIRNARRRRGTSRVW
jgi:hypothetical protein